MARDAFTDFGAVPVRTLAVLYSSYSHLVAKADAGISSDRPTFADAWYRRAPLVRALPSWHIACCKAAGLDPE